MKLFQKLLLVPATLSFLGSNSVNANDVNIDEISTYSDLENVEFVNSFNIDSIDNKLFAGGEGLVDSHEHDGGFSQTTIMSGSASSQIGTVDESALTEALTFTYAYDIDLNTSFTGEDNLYVGIEAGNATALIDFTLDSSNVGNDALNITSIYYEFPFREYQIAVGPQLDADDLMPTTTSAYSDSFFFGSQYGLSSNYFASQGTGPGFAVARTFDNGWNASGGIIGTGGNSPNGILTNEGIDIITLSLGYDADNYGGGLVFQNSDSSCTLAGNFATALCNDFGITDTLDEGYSSYTLGAYYSPNEKTTYSITSSTVDADVTGVSVESITDFQFAVDRELGNGTLSASWKTFPFFTVPDLNGTEINQDDLGSFAEIYYTYEVNDSFTITPGIAFALPTQDVDDITDDLGFSLLDRTAIGVGTTFKF